MEKQFSNAQWCWEHFMTSWKQSESTIAGKEETRELTSHAGQDEQTQSVVLGCRPHWGKDGSLNHGTMEEILLLMK